MAAGGEPPCKKAKTNPKGDLVTFLSRVRNGKYATRSTDQDKQEAGATLLHYQALGKEQKTAFANAYQDNKDKKTFQWARDFLQTVSSTTEDESLSTCKYMTRSHCILFFFVSMRLLQWMHCFLAASCVMIHQKSKCKSKSVRVIIYTLYV